MRLSTADSSLRSLTRIFKRSWRPFKCRFCSCSLSFWRNSRFKGIFPSSSFILETFSNRKKNMEILSSELQLGIFKFQMWKIPGSMSELGNISRFEVESWLYFWFQRRIQKHCWDERETPKIRCLKLDISRVFVLFDCIVFHLDFFPIKSGSEPGTLNSAQNPTLKWNLSFGNSGLHSIFAWPKLDRNRPTIHK